MDTTEWILIGAIPVLLGIGVFVFMRARKPKEEATFYFRCPGCRRKLRYQPRQIGHKGMCSFCKEQFTFPAPVAGER
jgi:rRNA maturation endonuclease Nob1